jgi:hypothetical protein
MSQSATATATSSAQVSTSALTVLAETDLHNKVVRSPIKRVAFERAPTAASDSLTSPDTDALAPEPA